MAHEKHLDFIHQTITRMASNSFLIKGWSVMLTASLLAVGATVNRNVALVAILPIMVFWGLDAYYLRHERLFRALYDHVAHGGAEPPCEAFGMSTAAFRSMAPGWPATLFAPTVFWIHATTAAIAAGIWLFLDITERFSKL